VISVCDALLDPIHFNIVKHRFSPQIQGASSLNKFGKLGSLSQSPLFNVPLGGSISLLPTGAYYVEVAVGSPPQDVLALLDTGSSDFLVTTKGCNSCNKSSTYQYNISTSSSAQYVKCDSTEVKCPKCYKGEYCEFYNAYVTCVENNPDASCVMYGPVINDLFTVPGTTLVVPVNFGAIEFMNITFPGTMTAIWGVSYKDQTGFGETGPLQALVNAGEINNIFGVCIMQDNGTMSIGGVDELLYSNWLGYSPIDRTSGYYGIKTTDVQISGMSIGLKESVYNLAGPSLIDSGTFSEVFPTEVYNKINQIINATCPSSSLVGVCNMSYENSLFNGVCFDMTEGEIDAFPTISVVFDGVTVGFNGTNYLVENILSPGQYCYGIQDGGRGSLVIHGDVLMKNHYTVFDSVNFQIGFADTNPSLC